MRLPIVITAGLVLSLGLNAPVIAQSPIELAQSSQTNLRSQLKQLRINRRWWRRANISSYRYTFSNGCFCVPEARGPVVIEVINGQTTSITSVETGEPVNRELFQAFDTIPKLFQVIANGIRSRADRLEVDYDPTLGYPTQITIDFSFQIADEELFLGIRDFEVIE
ncbi:MAG: hypothetical protein F6K36_08285 [Symploca sp. SIO3C6]|nr:hypothetical protein [Symploca sp. SIO3C6]